MTGESRRWTQAGGIGGLLFVVLLLILVSLGPLTNPVPEPPFDASSQALLAYAKAGQDPPRLALAGFVGLFGFLVFAASLAARFRAAREGSSIPWILVIATATVLMVMWLADFALAVGGDFRKRDLDATTASILFGIANGIFVASWAAIGGFLAASGAAALWSRALPSWLGWSALVIGPALFLTSAVPLQPIWYYPYFLFYIWVAATSVILLRSAP